MRLKFTQDQIDTIYDKTDGQCHICHKKISYCNYGKLGTRGAWEIDHSVPIAMGGTNNLNNLYPACTRCNRSKGSNSTRSERARFGHTSAPESKKSKTDRTKRNKEAWLVLGGLFVTVAAISISSSQRINRNEET